MRSPIALLFALLAACSRQGGSVAAEACSTATAESAAVVSAASAPTAAASPASAPSGAPAAPGCERDLSGMWRHADDATYVWHLSDDRTTVEFHPLRGQGGHAAHGKHHHGPLRDEQARISLTRRGTALAGAADSRARTLDGTTECAVSFRTYALSCSESEIVLSMEASYNVGEDCKRQEDGHPNMVTHRLFRQ